MKIVNNDTAVAIQSPEIVYGSRVVIDWDNDGNSGDASTDNVSKKLSGVSFSQALDSILPESVRVVEGSAVAQLDVTLGAGHVFHRAATVQLYTGSVVVTGSGSTLPNSRSIRVPAPAGVQPGELVLLFIGTCGMNYLERIPVSIPQWETLAWIVADGFSTSYTEGWFLTRRAVAGDPSMYTFDINQNEVFVAVAMRVGNAYIAGIQQIGAQPSTVTSNSKPNAIQIQNPAVEVTIPGSMIISGFISDSNFATGTVGSPMDGDIELADTKTTNSTNTNVMMLVTYQENAPVGTYRKRATIHAPNGVNTNWTFESGISGWATASPTIGTVTWSSAQSWQGDYSLRLVPDGVSSTARASSDELPAVAGTSYNFSAWVLTSATATLNTRIEWFNAAHASLSSNLGVAAVVPPNVWTRIAVAPVAPANTAFMRIAVVVDGTPPSTLNVYVDAALVISQASSVVANNAYSGLSVVIAPMPEGDETQHAGLMFSDFYKLSPYWGKVKTGRRITWGVDILTASGISTVPMFTGLTLSNGAASRPRETTLVALDNRETMRNPARPQITTRPLVAEFPLPMSGETWQCWPGLETTHLVSRLFHYAMEYTPKTRPEHVGPYSGAGYFPSPTLRSGTMLWVPCHGSLHPFAGVIKFAFQEDALGQRARVQFTDGPYVGATVPTPYLGSTQAKYDISNAFTGMWSGATGQMAGRIEFMARLSETDSYVTVRTDDANNNVTADLEVYTSSTNVMLYLNREGTTRTVTGPVIPVDKEWHAYGVHFDSVAGQAIFAIDNVETVVAFAAFANLTLFTPYQFAYVTSGGTAQFAEIFMDGGIAANPIWNDYIIATDPWITEGFVPTAFIDKSGYQIDAAPKIDPLTDTWQLLSEMAASDYSAIYFDEKGYPHWRTAQSDVSVAGQTLQRTVTTRNALKDLGYNLSLQQVANEITVPYVIIEFFLDKTIFELSNVVALPPYSNVTIPFTTPGLSLPYGATVFEGSFNTAADGSGTVVSGAIISAIVSYDYDTGYVRMSNTLGYTVYMVDATGTPDMYVTGSWYQESTTSGDSYVISSDLDSQKKYRTQPMSVSLSSWRQSEESAYALSERLLSELSKPRALLKNVRIIADPRLQIGDLVKIQDPDGIGMDNTFRLTGYDITDNGGSLIQSIYARESTVVATWDVNYWDDGSVWGE